MSCHRRTEEVGDSDGWCHLNVGGGGGSCWVSFHGRFMSEKPCQNLEKVEEIDQKWFCYEESGVPKG